MIVDWDYSSLKKNQSLVLDIFGIFIFHSRHMAMLFIFHADLSNGSQWGQ
jgi:hypothetical protein